MKDQNKVGGSARVSSHGGHVNGVQAEGEQDDEEDERCKLLFVDGIADSVSYHQIRELFCQHGRLLRVFVQRQRKPGRKLRFGFIKFNERSSTMAAMDALDGLKIGGAFLSVKLAKFPGKHDLGLGKGPVGAQVVFKERYVPAVQVWQRKNDASSLSSSSWRDALLGAHNSCRDHPLSKEEESMILNLPRLFDDEVSAIPVESLFPEYFLQGLGVERFQKMGVEGTRVVGERGESFSPLMLQPFFGNKLMIINDNASLCFRLFSRGGAVAFHDLNIEILNLKLLLFAPLGSLNNYWSWFNEFLIQNQQWIASLCQRSTCSATASSSQFSCLGLGFDMLESSSALASGAAITSRTSSAGSLSSIPLYASGVGSSNVILLGSSASSGFDFGSCSHSGSFCDTDVPFLKEGSDFGGQVSLSGVGFMDHDLPGLPREEGEDAVQASSSLAEEGIILEEFDPVLEFSPPKPRPRGRPRKKHSVKSVSNGYPSRPRGRPRKSDGLDSSSIPPPVDRAPSSGGYFTRATKAGCLAKSVSMVFPGSDDEAIRGLTEELRENWPVGL